MIHRVVSLPWNKSLRNKPMKPGEKRELTMLMPGITGVQVVTTTLQAQAVETVELLDGSQQLLKILMGSQIGTQQLDSICWTSPDGEVLKTSVPSLQQTIYRTTQKRAQAAGTGDYDLGQDSIVKIATPLPHPHQLTRAEYRISLPQKDPSQVFVSGGSQRVQPIDQKQARVTVLAVRPGSPLTGADDPAPGARRFGHQQLGSIRRSADREDGTTVCRRRIRPLDQVPAHWRKGSTRQSKPRISGKDSPRQPMWPARWRGIAPNTLCCWPLSAEHKRFPLASPWGSSIRAATKDSPSICGTKRGSRTAGSRWMPRSGSAGSAQPT